MHRRSLSRRPSARALISALVCVASLVAGAAIPAVASAQSSPGRPSAVLAARERAALNLLRHPASSGGQPSFRPRIGTAMGIMPRLGIPELASGTNFPVVYHGGSVMRNVTVHTIFWAPAGYRFDGSPGSGVLGYEALTKQFLLDVAHDSAAPGNEFSTLVQYHDGQGAGSTRIAYDPSADSYDDTDPYPGASRQCASPSGVAACVTDLQLEHELDAVISRSAPSARGLTNLWYVFLPPGVDTCLTANSCATNAFAGYHSEFDLGHGTTIYVSVPDPLVELTPSPGSDPQGNPEAEETVDTVAHETEEAITDPLGDAWMDPNGFEVADKCENGPQYGTALGYAPDGSPYNQVISGHQYLLQDMWSNGASGCVAGSTQTGSPLPLHSVSMRQYSPYVSGSTGVPGRAVIELALARNLQLVATAAVRTRANGSWGPVALRDPDGRLHGVGDDREALLVVDGVSASAPVDAIATGDGGDPFTESGYTGWYDLDHFASVLSHSVLLGPCSQVGVLSLRVGTRLTQPPAQACGTESDLAELATPRIGPDTPVTLSDVDNRASTPLEPNGALVKLTVSLGQPYAVPASGAAAAAYATGVPTCTAFVRIRSVRCAGLVPRGRYRVADHSARADRSGVVFVSGLRLRAGGSVTLATAGGRRLTTLRIAHLRVLITGSQTVLAGGTCQPGDFYGPPLSSPPQSSAVGAGAFGEGTVCPPDGRAKGLPVADIAQTDDLSGGQTVVSVPQIISTAPLQDETLYGSFIASAQSGLPGAHGSSTAAGVPIALAITRAGSHRRAFFARNVDTARGVAVSQLAPGTYTAAWRLHDANGDTRTLTTRFTEQ